MIGRPFASWLSTETPCFSASPRVSSITSCRASFISTGSNRGDAFCMSARIRPTMAPPVSVLNSSGERFSDLLQIRRVSTQESQRRNDVVARRRNRLLDLMCNRSAEFPHCYEAVRVRQLHLQLAVLPLATDNFQGNGRLRSEVCDQFDFLLRKGFDVLSQQSKRAD